METAVNQQIIELLEPFVTDNKKEKIAQISKDRTNYLTVVLEDIFQPHNASAVVRTCECFGIQNLHIIETRNPYKINPDVVMGSSKWVTMNRYNTPNQNNSEPCFNRLRSEGYKLVATTPHKDGFDLEDLPIDSKIALLFGTEKDGLTDYALDQADYYCKVPMYGFTESFNISVTAALFIHFLNSKIRKADLKWQLSQEEQIELIANWYKKIVKNSDILIQEMLKG